MLNLLEYHGNIALVGYEAEEKIEPEITDWNVKLGTFSVRRTAYITLPTGWTEETLRLFLLSRPRASIFNKVAHNPIMEPGDTDIDYLVRTQRIVIEGKPYIDMFGLHVYIASRTSWDSTSDVDLRFSSNQYPYRHLDPEVEAILNADYDLLNRKSPDKQELPGIVIHTVPQMDTRAVGVSARY